MRRLSLRTPGRGGGRRGPGCSGRERPGPLPAPYRAEESEPQFPQFLYLGAAPHQSHQDSGDITRINLSAVRASCRLMQLRCWVVPGRDSSSFAGAVRRVSSLHSAVVFNQAAIPPGHCRHKWRQRPVGRPGHGRPGRWRRQCQFVPRTSRSPNRHRLRGSLRINVVAVVLLFVCQCQFAKTVIPRINAGAALTGWAVPAQAPEAVCPRTSPVSSAAPGSLWSPFRGAPEPADPHAARPPPWPRSTRFTRSAPLVTGRLIVGARNPDAHILPSMRLPATKADWITHA